MVYKHAYLNTLGLLHSAFMLSVVKMQLKDKVEGRALNSHDNYMENHGKIMELCFSISVGTLPSSHQRSRLSYTINWTHLEVVTRRFKKFKI